MSTSCCASADLCRPEPYRGPPLDERDLPLLAELAHEWDARVTFQGLRRRLGVHQQALARALRRLEGDGLVARSPEGYHLTELGFSALWGHARPRPPRDTYTLLQALLPPHTDDEAVARRLARRWTGPLRWYGEARNPGETTLAWLLDPSDALLKVRIAGGALAIESEDSGEAAFAAAGALLAALSDLYRAPDAPAPGPGHEAAGATRSHRSRVSKPSRVQ